MGEAILNRFGRAHPKAHSARDHSRGEVHPKILVVLSKQWRDLSGLGSKSWTNFADRPYVAANQAP